MSKKTKTEKAAPAPAMMCGACRNFYVSGTPVRVSSLEPALQEELYGADKEKKVVKLRVPMIKSFGDQGVKWIREASQSKNVILSYDIGHNQIRTFHGTEVIEFRIIARPGDRMEIEFLFAYHHTEDGCSPPPEYYSPARVMTWNDWDEFIAKGMAR